MKPFLNLLIFLHFFYYFRIWRKYQNFYCFFCFLGFEKNITFSDYFIFYLEFWSLETMTVSPILQTAKDISLVSKQVKQFILR